jgi:hypothetical protein
MTYIITDENGQELGKADTLEKAAAQVTGHLVRDKAISKEQADQQGPELRELAEGPAGYPGSAARTWEYFHGGRSHGRYVVEPSQAEPQP